jgi:hypothetical protein
MFAQRYPVCLVRRKGFERMASENRAAAIDLTMAERRLFAPSAPPVRHVETISNAAKIS